jgi:hypothetical protein
MPSIFDVRIFSGRVNRHEKFSVMDYDLFISRYTDNEVVLLRSTLCWDTQTTSEAV